MVFFGLCKVNFNGPKIFLTEIDFIWYFGASFFPQQALFDGTGNYPSKRHEFVPYRTAPEFATA